MAIGPWQVPETTRVEPAGGPWIFVCSEVVARLTMTVMGNAAVAVSATAARAESDARAAAMRRNMAIPPGRVPGTKPQRSGASAAQEHPPHRVFGQGSKQTGRLSPASFGGTAPR